MTWQIIATPATTLKGPGVLHSIDNSKGEGKRPEKLHLLGRKLKKFFSVSN